MVSEIYTCKSFFEDNTVHLNNTKCCFEGGMSGIGDPADGEILKISTPMTKDALTARIWTEKAIIADNRSLTSENRKLTQSILAPKLPVLQQLTQSLKQYLG